MNAEQSAVIAGHRIHYCFHNAGTALYILEFNRGPASCQIRPDQTAEDSCDTETEATPIMASPENIEMVRELSEKGLSDPYLEFRALIGETSLALLKHRCCLFHAVSFVFKGKAVLLTGPSGVGKTTQYRNWVRSHPGEIVMISGDMPALQTVQTGGISVHPSPWNGKEKYRSWHTAPLGMVICLEQGTENHFSALPANEAIVPLMDQFLVLPETEEQVHSVASILETLLSKYPVFRFTNNGTPDSTELLRSMILGKFDRT